MNTIKFSYDRQSSQSKPSGDEIRRINSRIARSAQKLDRDGLMEKVAKIGNGGHTFSPATFKNGRRNKDNFEQQQLFALDFDNKDPKKKLTFEEVKERARQFEMPILFAYDTMSSMDHDKFRFVFLNDVAVTDRRVAEAMQLAIGEMFPEADPSCYKDVSKLYFGGKGLLHYGDEVPQINIESVFRNYTYCMRKRYKDNHYKEHIAKFSKETGIALTKKGLLDIRVADHLPEPDDPTEDTGASQYIENGKNSPTAIIYDKDYIKANGEIFPNKYYVINFSGTRNSSVKTPGEKYINVSATADEEIYGWYFGEENVDFYECKKAEYRGELKQYYEKSMSRTCVAKDSGIVARLMRRFGMSRSNVITFMNQGIGELHFGNTEGSNMLEGENILVVGTPYHVEFLYKLAAFSMGVEFEEDEKMTKQTTEHNGYCFIKIRNTVPNAEARLAYIGLLSSDEPAKSDDNVKRIDTLRRWAGKRDLFSRIVLARIVFDQFLVEAEEKNLDLSCKASDENERLELPIKVIQLLQLPCSLHHPVAVRFWNEIMDYIGSVPAMDMKISETCMNEGILYDCKFA